MTLARELQEGRWDSTWKGDTRHPPLKQGCHQRCELLKNVLAVGGELSVTAFPFSFITDLLSWTVMNLPHRAGCQRCSCAISHKCGCSSGAASGLWCQGVSQWAQGAAVLVVYWWCNGPCWAGGSLSCCPSAVPRAHTVPADVPGLKTSVVVACWLEVLGFFFQSGEDPSLQPYACLTQVFAVCWCRSPHSYPQIS